MQRAICFFSLLLGLLAVLLSLDLQPARAAGVDTAGARVVLILDASKSMSQRLTEKTQFESAQDAIGTLLTEWETGDELGILVVGHRFDGDCEDVERRVPLAPPDIGRVRRALAGLKPVGASPIGVALKRAVAELDAERNGGAVIVLSDGATACNRDLCKEVAEIAKKAPNLKVHLIGIGAADSAALEGIQCLASGTGGTSVTVKDPVALQQALRKAMQIIHQDVIPGTYFSATYAEGGAAVDGKIYWVVYEEKPDGSRGRSVRYGDGASMRFVLMPGKYQVVASLGAANASKSIEIKEGQGVTRHVLNLNAGFLKLRATYPGGSGSVADSAAWTVQAEKQGKKTRVTSSYGAQSEILLPAGEYFVLAELGVVKSEVQVEIKAGASTEQTVALQAGTLNLLTALKPDGAPFNANIAWELYEAGKTNAPRIASSYGSRASYVLPEGQYQIRAAYSGASASLDAKVKAGVTQDATLVFNAGTVEIVPLKQFGDAINERVDWAIYEAGTAARSTPKLVIQLSGASVSVLLPTGKYIIRGVWQQLSGDREVEVVADTSVVARVRLRPPED